MTWFIGSLIVTVVFGMVLARRFAVSFEPIETPHEHRDRVLFPLRYAKRVKERAAERKKTLLEVQ